VAWGDTTREKRGRRAEPQPKRAPRRRPQEREPNAVDHYSLALQIIQVFPIVTEPIVLVLPNAWIARTVAGIALIGGTTLVIRIERHRHARALRRHRKPSNTNRRGLSSLHAPPNKPGSSTSTQDGATASAGPRKLLHHGRKNQDPG